MNINGYNMVEVKRRNRSAILRYINKIGPISRKDIATATGLTAASVTLICNELIAQNILRETGELVALEGAGRKKVLLDINWDYKTIIGINIEPENTTVVISNLSGDPIAYLKEKTNKKKSPSEFLKSICDACVKLMKDKGIDHSCLSAVSVGITGIVDKNAGVSKHAYGVWDEEVDVCSIISSYLDLPCYLENNVNAFAMAENFMGWGKMYDNLLVVKWGPGVGSAIIVDGEIYEGRHGKAAELGHIIVGGKIKCSCGRVGCLETLVDYKHLCPDGRYEMEDMSKLLTTGSAFEDAIDIFARILINSATVLAPNRVVLYGPFFKDEKVRKYFINACKQYDVKLSERIILYSGLMEKEDYIGTIASFLSQEFF